MELRNSRKKSKLQTRQARVGIRGSTLSTDYTWLTSKDDWQLTLHFLERNLWVWMRFFLKWLCWMKLKWNKRRKLKRMMVTRWILCYVIYIIKFIMFCIHSGLSLGGVVVMLTVMKYNLCVYHINSCHLSCIMYVLAWPDHLLIYKCKIFMKKRKVK